MNALEAFTNAALGLFISWAATRFILGYDAAQSLGITLMFFGFSFARGYVVRSVFARWK